MKIFVLSRRVLTAVAAVALAAAMVLAVNMPAAVGASATQRQLPIYAVEPAAGEKKIAISFDAAWGADDTDTLIDILGEYNVSATFFLVGQWVDAYPEEVKKLHEAGHEVMNHSNTHPYFTQCATDTVISEIEACNDKIEAITGVRPTLIRCPYGDYNDAVINAVRSLDMEPIQWSVDSLDWKDSATAQSIYDRVVSQVEPGSIILCHNDAEYTPDALANILKTLQEEGYTFVPISELILPQPYTIDHAGVQHPAG
ncbi:MAG: polysaccharide deacetylase family protein [Oscillospiraceae bacterium]|nr:polysaccharide deacetylase family protein [Oscillospiraceae bacterium]